MSELAALSKKYRRELFEKFVQVGQGHPGSVFSMLDIVVTLFCGGFLRFDKPANRFYDKVLISKGHATVALYPILRDYGVIPEEDWTNWGKGPSCLRVFGNTSIPGIDVASGSLGHGIGVGAGMALGYKRAGIDKKVFVVISEGELYEGSTWEGLLFAAHHKLDNLVVFIDINSLIILGTTTDCLGLNPIKDKVSGLGFEVSECDGHDHQALAQELGRSSGLPRLILAKTIKGKGFSLMENQAHWHYMQAITPAQIDQCRKEIA